ncbi:alpha/beta hydrolase [Anaerostipes sp.]|uniref:alpha/beta hydrolase n=1 Tax=Anaerostipes sp. TaxID=1872530 RepID=UPI002587D550|nr:alpha/beta hydrolase family protein [Anaerostipes sp.]MCI5623319.1 esterase family protein [Anaerostipes sp.]
MALIHCNFYSYTLGKDTGAYVILPEHRDIKNMKQKLKTLFLFHGLNDDYTKWIRRTLVEQYVKPDDWAVIMPDAEKGYYTNAVHGNQYGDFFGEELPQIMRTVFPLLSERREDNFIAGLSMGGFGSFRCALSYPEQYCAAASFSGALNIRRERKDYPKYAKLYEEIFGSFDKDNIKRENDLFYLAEKLKKEGKQIPRLYITCGKQDDMYPQSQEFIQYMDKIDVPYTYEEWEGIHDWKFWDESLRRALKWFLQNKYEKVRMDK